MIKNVVFDLGGVLIDWDPVKIRQEYPERDLVDKLMNSDFFCKYWADFDRGVYSQEELAHHMSDYLHFDYDKCWDFTEYVRTSLVNIPKTEKLISILKDNDYRLYCLSNMSHEYYDYMKDREVFSLFDGRIISAQESCIKPEDKIYKILLDRYNLLPEETLFVDDLKDNISKAEEFGIKTVHFKDKDYGYKRIAELLELKDFQ